MTGAFTIVTDVKKARIKAITEEEESASVIAERLNLSKSQVYYHQVQAGLREPKKRNKGARNANLPQIQNKGLL